MLRPALVRPAAGRGAVGACWRSVGGHGRVLLLHPTTIRCRYPFPIRDIRREYTLRALRRCSVDVEMTIARGDLPGGPSAGADPGGKGVDGAAAGRPRSARGRRWWRCARSGDRAAADELASRFTKPAYLVALQLLGNPEDARDAAQNALMRFFARLDRLEPGRPIRPWLFTIVRNAALRPGPAPHRAPLRLARRGARGVRSRGHRRKAPTRRPTAGATSCAATSGGPSGG